MLSQIAEKTERIIVGLMSGTSVDGIDAALVSVGSDVRLLAFENIPFPDHVRSQIFTLFDPAKATIDRVGYMHVLLGELYARAALSVIAKAGMRPDEVDIIGCHGQTIWHAPEWQDQDGIPVHYTVQIGDGAVIAERTGIVTVSDFRSADLAAGGNGAPVVPFTEYAMYRKEKETVLLQNIGGIGNITILPAHAKQEEVYAFDTGPGNMIIDAVVSSLTEGRKSYDVGGEMAKAGNVNETLLAELQEDPYYAHPLPKTTGREHFGTQYTERILKRARELGMTDNDIVATVTDLTAWSIQDAYVRFVLPNTAAAQLIVGGGGSYNLTLMELLRKRFASYGVRVITQEDLGMSSDAKEAVAFAVLADCCIREMPNTIAKVTGARRATVMGKISIPSGKGDLA